MDDKGKTKRDSIRRQLENVISLRNSEDQVVWTIFGIFNAATAILLVALFPDGRLPINPVGMVITGIGGILSFVWFNIQNRANKHVKMNEALIETLERKLIGIDNGVKEEEKEFTKDMASSGYINTENFNKFVGEGVRVRTWMKYTPLGLVVLWGLGFLFFLIKLICQAII